jgi:hypothetical protein
MEYEKKYSKFGFILGKIINRGNNDIIEEKTIHFGVMGILI